MNIILNHFTAVIVIGPTTNKSLLELNFAKGWLCQLALAYLPHDDM
jgi:hypothetical protein